MQLDSLRLFYRYVRTSCTMVQCMVYDVYMCSRAPAYHRIHNSQSSRLTKVMRHYEKWTWSQDLNDSNFLRNKTFCEWIFHIWNCFECDFNSECGNDAVDVVHHVFILHMLRIENNKTHTQFELEAKSISMSI